MLPKPGRFVTLVGIRKEAPGAHFTASSHVLSLQRNRAAPQRSCRQRRCVYRGTRDHVGTRSPARIEPKSPHRRAAVKGLAACRLLNASACNMATILQRKRSSPIASTRAPLLSHARLQRAATGASSGRVNLSLPNMKKSRPGQKAFAQVAGIGRGDERLNPVLHFAYEKAAPRRVEFGHDVVEEQHRGFTDLLFHVADFGKLARQHRSTLLALGAEDARIDAVDLEEDIIPLGTDGLVPLDFGPPPPVQLLHKAGECGQVLQFFLYRSSSARKKGLYSSVRRSLPG